MRRLSLVAVLCVLLAIPAAAAPPPPFELPADAPRYAHTYEKVRVPMRDGVEISAEIWRPLVPGDAPVPVILHFTPYHVLQPLYSGSADATALPDNDAKRYVPRGYAYVLADVRGTWASGGCWDYGGVKEREDGYDLVEWLGTQAWSNGRVAMMGVSYPGTTPNAAAVEQPPHLATIVPMSGISRWYGYAYQQGVRATTSGTGLDVDPPVVTPPDFLLGYGAIPPPSPDTLANIDQVAMRWNLCDRVEQALHGYDTQPDYDAFWQERDYLARADQVHVPVLVSHGQLDFNVKTWEGTAWFEALDVEKVLVLGQWPHAHPRGRYREWDKLVDRWFERWLYDVPNGVEHEPAVRVQTNDGVWREQEAWGATATTPRRFPLGDTTFTFADDGALTETEMLRGTGEGRRWGRVPLPEATNLRFAGRPVLHVSATSDAPGTHLVAVLCDVGADGACSVVSRAFTNARYRGGLAEGVDLVPGERFELALEFIDKDHVVAPGRHLELRIASSSSTWVASDEHRATNTLHLADSWLELPVYER
jgi:X-Pro dipeptidyl-peptidase